MFRELFLLVLSAYVCNGIIYHLNESEYRRMPPIFHLDDYAPCVDHRGQYCYVYFDLIADTTSDLLTMIREYSAQIPMHFNYSKLQYGICITQTCQDILQQNTTLDLRETLEECLNKSMWKDYELKTKVTEFTCHSNEQTILDQIDFGDIIVAVFCISLFVFNVIGSLQECTIEKDNQGNKFFACFSLKRNWQTLVAPPKTDEAVKVDLQAFYGASNSAFKSLLLRILKYLLAPGLVAAPMFQGCYNGCTSVVRMFAISSVTSRTITTMLVICCHSMMPFVISSQNPQQWEEEALGLIKFVGNGTLIVQTFFAMSGFLLAYYVQLYSERMTITCAMLPKKILMRWLRLIPAQAVILAITATWLRFLPSGPLWQPTLGVTVQDCRRDWWVVLLYGINYIDGSQCMPETWYLAADIQLTILGVFVCVLLKGKTQVAVFVLLFVAGGVLPAAHTYLQDLDATVLLSPETSRNIYVKDPTFTHVYIRGHTNLGTYVMGMVTGLVVYHWQTTTTGEKLKMNKTFRFLFWLTVPLAIVLISVGAVFYSDAPRAALWARTLFAGIIKPVYGILAAIHIIGLAFRVERVYRGIMSWRIWVSPARISYSAYLLHVFLIRIYCSTRMTLIYTSYLNIFTVFGASIAGSFLVALPYWLLVEAPITNVVKLVVQTLGWMPKKSPVLEKNEILLENGNNGPVTPSARTNNDWSTMTKL